MYLCYLDESGTPEREAQSSHFVLLGLAIPAASWRTKDQQIDAIKERYGLKHKEVHTAWMNRDYPEQRRVPNFESLTYGARRTAVLGVRVLNLARSGNRARSLTKNYKKSADFVHLTRQERISCLQELADLIGSWSDCRLFAEARDKGKASTRRAFEVGFEQVITRFNAFLRKENDRQGLLVQDNNETVAKRITLLARHYHQSGTQWTGQIERIVETPLFVDSELTSMVQLADLAAYALRRFFEKDETDLLGRIYPAADRSGGRVVGFRHFTGSRHPCACRVCKDHGRQDQVEQDEDAPNT